MYKKDQHSLASQGKSNKKVNFTAAENRMEAARG